MDWCILRTKGSSTLRLARSLSLAGIDAWTPVEHQQRKKGKHAEVITAVMPTYVFAPAEHLVGLIALAEAPIPHPDFSVFRYHDRFPVIPDAQLQSLRLIERKAAAKCAPVVFPKGAEIRVPDGAFQGLTGQVVEDSKGKFTLVLFPGLNIEVKFPSWQLERAA